MKKRIRRRFWVVFLGFHFFLFQNTAVFFESKTSEPCATCGMTGCGTVCCCSLEEGAYHCANEKHEGPGLFAAGCKEIQKTLQSPSKAVLNFLFLAVGFLKTDSSTKPFRVESVVLPPWDPPPRVFS